MTDILYRCSYRNAVRNNETDIWRLSYLANIECKIGIDRMLSDRFDGHFLHGNCAEDLCLEYGIDRVGWVLADTVQHASWDARYRPDTREWAESFRIPTDAEDHTSDYCLRSHPEIVNGLCGEYREYVNTLGLHGSADCIPDSSYDDYSYRLLILRPEILKDEYKKGDYQYFFAKLGSGCSPTSRGRQVFGEFLCDGEKTHFDRHEFIGIADETLLPDWAKEKLAELIDGPSSEQTM